MGQGISRISSQNLTKDQLLLLQKKFARLCRCPATAISAAATAEPAQISASQQQKQQQQAVVSARITDLQMLPELAGNPMIPRIFQLLDRDGDGSLSFEEFVAGVELFGTVQDEREDISRLYQLAFMVYDLNGDGFIDMVELYSMLQQIVGGGGAGGAAYSEQQLDRVVQATMQQYDSDGDGRLTPQEFARLLSTSDLYSKFTFTLY